MLLKIGSKGEDVLTLQMTLRLRGYDIGKGGPDGIFGDDTEKAVKEFQKDHKLQADGIVGELTQEALHHDYSGNTDYGELLQLGSGGPQVAEMQRLLIKAGYSVGSSGADGIFGAGTESAVKRFQESKGLAKDGIIGPDTKNALKNSNSSSSSLLKIGSTGPEVKELQRLLINTGFSVSSSGVDGIFGVGTENAVKRFQASKGLSKDGIVGPATWSALKGGTSSELLRLGSSGESVREAQNLLIKAGYSVGSSGADGKFGTGTENAVKKFQKAKGLGVDGIIGSATWGALRGSSGGSIVHVSGGPGVLKFIKVAEAQEFHERIVTSDGEGDNINPYGAWYGLNGVPWCAIFVSWCANQAGILGSIVPKYSYCENAVEWYRARGRYRTRQSGYTPKPGDVIFFYDASESAPFCHTGIVTGYENGVVITTEGNAKQAVRHNLRYPRNYWKIHGYGDNGGIKNSYTKKEIGEAASKVGFAKLLGISLSSDINEIHKKIGPMEITLKTGFSKTIGNPDGKINISNGNVDIELSNGNSGLNIESIKEGIKTLKKNGIDISHVGNILGNSITFEFNPIKPVKIILELETQILDDSLIFVQSIEVKLNKNYDDKDYHSNSEIELFGLISSIIMGSSTAIESIFKFLRSLNGSIPVIVRNIMIFLTSLALI